MHLRKPHGIAEKWYFIKGLCGNTSPAATLPFGKLECGCYGGGYSSGYTNHAQNAGVGRPSMYGWNIFSEKSFSVPVFTEKLSTFGISHMQPSGTGLCGTYYNYAVTTPFFGGIENITTPKAIEKEDARPGYYSMLTEDGIFCETTVSEKCAHHRYNFAKKGGRLAIDFANNGLRCGRRDLLTDSALDGTVTVIGENEVAADVVLCGIRMYFRVIVEGASSVSLFKSGRAVTENTVKFDFPKGCDEPEQHAGCIFECDSENVSVKLTITPKDAEYAVKLLRDETRTFDEISAAAYATWNKYLSAIEIEGDERTKRIFYSNMYHTLTKPCNWSGESYFSDKEEFFCDFVTLWDTYKTQTPLLFSLYPDVSSRIINFFLNYCEALEYFPHDFYMRRGSGDTTGQACMIAEYLMCDAFYRSTPDIDCNRVLCNIETDIKPIGIITRSKLSRGNAEFIAEI